MSSLKKAISQICILFLVNTIFATKASPLRTPIFNNRGGKYEVTLPYNGFLAIIRYEIMEGEIGADALSFTPMHSQDTVNNRGSSIHIDISHLDINSGKQYSICVTTNDGTFYSEPFIYDESKNNYVLTRIYKGKPFYIRFLPHAGAILAVGVVGGAIIYIINRRATKSIPEDNL